VLQHEHTKISSYVGNVVLERRSAAESRAWWKPLLQLLKGFTLGFGSCVIIFFFVAVMILVFIKWPPKDSGHIASWVQATGTFIAIIATSLLARSDIRARNKQERLRKQVRVEVFLGLADQLHAYSDCLVENVKSASPQRICGYFEYGAPIGGVKTLSHMIDEAALPACVNREMVSPVLLIRQAAQELSGAMSSAQRQYTENGCVPYPDHIMDMHDHLSEGLRQLGEAADLKRPRL